VRPAAEFLAVLKKIHGQGAAEAESLRNGKQMALKSSGHSCGLHDAPVPRLRTT